jgi:NAD(P)-dependent dehydrogenase (short-subunit alcohol dehydrogenase family)
MSVRVLITGASGGIGSAAADELRGRGAHVAGLDLEADEAAGVLACDLRDEAAVERGVAAAIERLGGLDVLINNAGLGIPQSAGRAPDDRALAVLEVNLIAPWRVTAAALPALRQARGRVINVASGLAHLAVPFAPAYGMSKRGLVAYSDALRLEYGDEITVTTVYPGYIRTGIHAASKDSGVGLEGAVPPERVEDAAHALVAPRGGCSTSSRRPGCGGWCGPGASSATGSPASWPRGCSRASRAMRGAAPGTATAH